jgi:PAS domain S-box-containing protein
MFASLTKLFQPGKKNKSIADVHLQTLSGALENSPLAIAITAPNGNIEYINRAFSRLTGYTLEEAIGKNPNLLKSGHMPEEVYQEMWTEISAGRAWSGEVQNRAKDGTTYWQQLSITPILDEKNNVIHYVGLGYDIAQSKKNEQDFLRERVELEARVKERTEELERMACVEAIRRKELEKLRQVGLALREAGGDPHYFLDTLADEMRQLASAKIAAGLLIDQSYFTFCHNEDQFPSAEQTEAIRAVLKQGANSKSGTIISLPNGETGMLFALQSADTLHGSILLVSDPEQAFAEEEVNILTAVADMASNGLQRIDLLNTMETRVDARTRELVVLYNLMTIISENWRLEDVLELSLVLTLETANLSRGIIYLTQKNAAQPLKAMVQRGFKDTPLDSLPGMELAQEVYNTRKAISSKTITLASVPNPCEYTGMPLISNGEILGVFSLFTSEQDKFSPETMALLTAISDHIGMGIANARNFEKTQASAVTEERNRLARDMHDSVSQLLYSLMLMTGSTRRLLEQGTETERVAASLERISETAHQALKEMRLLLYELRPGALDSAGLIGALRHRMETVEERAGIATNIESVNLPNLPDDLEEALYHIAQEALNNVIKHSQSLDVNVKLWQADNELVMEITDHGKGFEPNQTHYGIGLRAMQERAEKLGGRLEVQSQMEHGSSVRVHIPMSA